VTIRPQVGLGNASFGYTSSIVDGASNNDLYVEPGVTVLVALGALFVGADVSVLVFPGPALEEGSSPFFITFHGQVGAKF